MPQPTLTRIEIETNQMKKLQEENSILRNRLQSIGNQLIQPATSSSPKSSTSTTTTTTTTSTTHQSRRSTFHEQKGRLGDSKPHIIVNPNPNSLNDVIPFYIPPPPHLVDDFYIISQETLNIGNMADTQARSLRSLIRNISSGSPVMGRKESLDRGKKRSGSAGSRSWNLH